MAFAFKSSGKKAGWMSVVFADDRIDLAHCVRARDRRPEVLLLDTYRLEHGAEEALQRLKASHKLKNYRCTVPLRSGQYQLVQVEAPDVPASERAEALRWKLKDVVDFPVDSASIDVLDIPGDGQGRTPSVFVAAAAESAVAAAMKPFSAAGLALTAIDLPEIAQRNIATLFEEPNRGLAFLFLDEGGGVLTMSFHGELYAVRRIDISATQLSEAGAERRDQLLERIALELQRSLDTFDRQYSFVSVARLVVACARGQEFLLPYLAENLYLPVAAMDLAEVMDFPSVPELKHPERQAQCLVAIGAALREGE